jgi:hypothetical protein
LTRRDLAWLIAALSGALVPGAAAQRAPEPRSAATSDSLRTALVTYISGQSVYVGAGRADGVREGTAIEVRRAGTVIATIRAEYLSSHSSSGSIVSSTDAPAVGDTVRYRPTIDQRATPIADSTVTLQSRAPGPPWRQPVRGHVGVRYVSISQPGAAGGAALAQPSADVHVEGSNVGGTSLGFVIDGRSRRTIGASAMLVSPIDQRTLVYEASISATQQRSGARVSIGRQYSTALSSVSLFDGMTAEINQPRWGLGLFGGTQPDVSTMDFSTDIREAGGYVQIHNRPEADVPWSVTTGAVDSRDLGQLNREFGFAQLSLNASKVSLFATQEVDVNRGWKRTAGEPAVSPTSTFGLLSIRPTDELTIQAGVDNRRNVRLYRDYISPETEFDDAFRQGVWGGATLTLRQRVRIGGDVRVSRGGPAGAASYYTGSLGFGPLTRAGLDVRVRSTSFETDGASGWLHAWSASVDPAGAVRLEVDGGLRTQRAAAGFTSSDTTGAAARLPDARWIGGSIDVSLGRSWYALLSGTRDGSGVDVTNQLYAGLVFRF